MVSLVAIRTYRILVRVLVLSRRFMYNGLMAKTSNRPSKSAKRTKPITRIAYGCTILFTVIEEGLMGIETITDNASGELFYSWNESDDFGFNDRRTQKLLKRFGWYVEPMSGGMSEIDKNYM